MKGRITQIQPFSLHDGPGIRTTVFFAGCNMRCRWCHNPEAFFASPRLRFFSVKCTDCGRCAGVCPVGAMKGTPAMLDRDCCLSCGRCAGACPHGALALSCRWVEDHVLTEEIFADKIFFAHTGGGVTFSGGEPFLQPEFLCATARRCKDAGVHTAVETAAEVPYSDLKPALPLIDLVICDLKAADDTLHQQGTGRSNQRILENLSHLCEDAKNLWIRIPLIPGFNDTKDELVRLGGLLSRLKADKVEILPFHNLGNEKYSSLGLEPLPVTESTESFSVEDARALLSSFAQL